eukprot:243462-Hanusia_phi.AAC.2
MSKESRRSLPRTRQTLTEVRNEEGEGCQLRGRAGGENAVVGRLSDSVLCDFTGRKLERWRGREGMRLVLTGEEDDDFHTSWKQEGRAEDRNV